MPEPLPPISASVPRRLSLPNGLEIACQTTSEARYFYEDIFVKRIYVRHGIDLSDAECVFDVGANIGLFTLFALRFSPRARVYAFEPAPALFEILRHNTAGHGEAVRLFHCGVSRRSGRGTLTFYLSSSGMSSFYGDPDEEREALRSIFENQRRQGVEGVEEVLEHADDLLAERLRNKTFDVELLPLSQVIRDEGVERIDLLKIDVQKSEEDVLAGIEPADWPKIRQVVVEVHDVAGRVERLREVLEERGFTVVADQDVHYESSPIWNLYAARSRPAETVGCPALSRTRVRAGRLFAAARSQRRGIAR